MIGEIHCHTNCSRPKIFHRGLPTPFQLIDHAKKIGLDFVAIADHDDQNAFSIVNEYALSKGIVVIPAVELTTRSKRLSRKRIHILAYGVTKKVPSRKSIEETIRNIHEQGGIAVIAHPFCTRFGKVLYLGHQTGDYKFDGIEIFNSDENPTDNVKAQALALVLDLPGFGGSDAHTLRNIGNTKIEIPIEKTSRWEDLVIAMKHGQLKIVSKEFNHAQDRQSAIHLMAHAIKPGHQKVKLIEEQQVI